ncbi:MAG TPA: helicase HerA-like domain-containing protein [Longimicrobium sp.]|nr:helicase HerA-like domain-containing protein [Longimicrobium sp.]
MNPDVLNAARAAFPPSTGTVTLGAVVHEGACHPEPVVTLPLSMLNRHGLIAGATGTGKTKTLQLIAEQLSAAGVPVFLSDVKGDLSGISTAGEESDRVRQRATDTGFPWAGAGMPVEFLSLSGKVGAQMRATVSSFGPLLLTKVLGLNDTQSSVLTLVFEYCDDKGLLLLDLSDLRAVLTYLSGEGADELKNYGGMSKATVGVLLRELIELEAQDAERFFGEPEFDLDDLLRTGADGRGVVSVLELQDVQEKPVLFSTFMLWMLATLYHTLPEVGDVDKPKLVFFFDEAHLLFDNASKALKDQVEQVVRLIRSKGVGVFFITQNPRDVPAEILGQLGHRVQHALRAFTPDDEQALRSAARTFPKTTFYDIEETLTTLGIGEALVTTLSPNGVPTQPFATRLVPPSSRMGPLTPDELRQRLAESGQVRKYAEMVDRESAREMLEARMAEDEEPEEPQARPGDDFPDVPRRGGHTARRPSADDDYDRGERSATRPRGRQQKSALEKVLSSPTSKQFARTLARGLMGALLGGRGRR